MKMFNIYFQIYYNNILIQILILQTRWQHHADQHNYVYIAQPPNLNWEMKQTNRLPGGHCIGQPGTSPKIKKTI